MLKLSIVQIKIALLLALAGCSSQNVLPEKELFYRRDIKLISDGAEGNGLLVLKNKKDYEIVIESKNKLDLLTITTCHREITQEKVSSGIFGNKNKYTWKFIPTEIELGYCPIEISGFEESKGRHAWGFIDREDESLKLDSEIECNGEKNIKTGISICQSKKGLIQKLNFQSEVKVVAQTGCEYLLGTDKKSITYKLPKGICLYLISDGINKHRHTAMGYESIIVREE